MLGSKQYVYAVANRYMPGLVKIGKTRQLDPSDRISQLFRGLGRAGIPHPFYGYAVQVADHTCTENKVKKILEDIQVPYRKEFFEIDLESAYYILQMHAVVVDEQLQVRKIGEWDDDLLPPVADSVSDDEEESEGNGDDAPSPVRSTRVVRFSELAEWAKINIDDELVCIGGKESTVKVASDFKVFHDGDIKSLHKATKNEYGDNKNRSALYHWKSVKHNGELLQDMRNRMLRKAGAKE